MTAPQQAPASSVRRRNEMRKSMQSERPNIITQALEAERQELALSGWAWVVFGFITQGALLWWARRQPSETALTVFVLVLSLFFAWWPLVRGIRQIWRARSLRRPDNLLRRALTTEPQLIAQVKLGTHKTIWTRLGNLVGTFINQELHKATNSWDEYGITGSGETVNNRLPCIVLKLLGGREYRLTTARDDAKLKELINALLAHAPHAKPVPEPAKGESFDDVAATGWLRLTMFLLGGPLFFICSLLLFAKYMDARERASLLQQGVRTTATVSRLSDYGGQGSDYNVAVDFTDQSGKAISAGTVKLVSKSDYETLKVGAPVEIIYRPRDPRDFRLVISLQRLEKDKTTFIVLASLSVLGLIMVLIGIVSAMRAKRTPVAAKQDRIVNPQNASY